MRPTEWRGFEETSETAVISVRPDRYRLLRLLTSPQRTRSSQLRRAFPMMSTKELLVLLGKQRGPRRSEGEVGAEVPSLIVDRACLVLMVDLPIGVRRWKVARRFGRDTARRVTRNCAAAAIAIRMASPTFTDLDTRAPVLMGQIAHGDAARSVRPASRRADRAGGLPCGIGTVVVLRRN
jgi:hypothetical protein